ncbi:Hedgehog/intein hint domain protein [Kribbella flavida DSM 17836]|uniref:Hedgehog/intein hint domain protein n=1 Tax=Kribbella flavida (strain DSM 17836 / JCM 10339 / NBRC 14399) TaxID=479435 RepID=D2PLF2_KRIFD|nr:Hedgehog/intein hint domain-containing protein [Kribbella flavida]ADB30581.1 Hedgehog/intein hint domain protein [Kribbella flavida DSM 17836]
MTKDTPSRPERAECSNGPFSPADPSAGEALLHPVRTFNEFKQPYADDAAAQRYDRAVGRGLFDAATLGTGGIGALGKAGKLGTRTPDRSPDGSCSFTGDTKVLMADGSTKPISEIVVGDEVLATDPETGETSARQVTHTWAHLDIVLDLEITADDDSDGAGDIIATTEDHPFWNATDHQYQRADHLDAGDKLLTASGRNTTVRGLRPHSQRHTTAHNLTVAGPHTYYVVAVGTPVLVHNTCPLRSASEAAFKAADDPASIFVKDKHLSSFGGRYSKFATTDKAEAQSWIAEGLRSDRASFRPNGLDGTFKVEVDMQRTIGTKGQTGLRAIVSDDGRVINAFPFEVR